MSINDNKQEWTWASFAALIWLSLVGAVVWVSTLVGVIIMFTVIFIHFCVTELNNLRGKK